MSYKLNVPIYLLVSVVHLQVPKLSQFLGSSNTMFQDPQGKGCKTVTTKDGDFKVVGKNPKNLEKNCVNDLGKPLNNPPISSTSHFKFFMIS